GQYLCDVPSCRSVLKRCNNDVAHGACNCLPDASSGEPLCIYCGLNQVIPSLDAEANLAKWRKLEAAKRRTLYTVRALGFPVAAASDPPLRFAFLTDINGPVTTGHENGLITINVREADDVERERTRVQMGEPQRTLVGHFRHELGHFYWDLLVKNQRLDEFRSLFGNELDPSYDVAMRRYYDQGPPSDWNEQFVSEYASMHPWEDFAETFNTYLDMASIVSTAAQQQIATTLHDDFESLLLAYCEIGSAVNELNREMGLKDLVPEIIHPTVAAKLRFVDELRRQTDEARPHPLDAPHFADIVAAAD
ncbi:MAG: putative zinc-binding metallopeptidase, partial [Planctomycetales bacterium]|nr:putative zinc-binding metallopeptidase [Planctomycetales bacterium]